MRKLDLNEPRFVQAELLKLVPGLSAKTLQNWLNRDVLQTSGDAPGRQGKRRWTPAGVIALRVMVQLTALGIPPTDAREVIDTIIDHITKLYDQYPIKLDAQDCPSWTIASDQIEKYHRGYVQRIDGKLRVLIQKGDIGLLRTLFPNFYIVIEVDFLAFAAFKIMHLFVAGLPLNPPEQADPEVADIVDFQSRLTSPGEM